MKERNLFAELVEGFDALAEERAGKRTLGTHEVETKPAANTAQDEPPPIVATLHLPANTKFVPVGEIAERLARAKHPTGGIEWAAAVQYHKQALDTAIRRGEIQAFEPATMRPLGTQLSGLPQDGSPLANAWVPIDDVRKFGRILGVEVETAIPSHPAEPPAAAVQRATSSNVADWKEKAREIADEFFEIDTANKCRDSLAGYSRRVMEEMQKREIHGARGRIDNANTIQREALQGDKWWQKKKK